MHYSVSESSGKLSIAVLNKQKEAGKVRVTTVDGDAKAGEDFDAVNTELVFSQGEYMKTFDVGIKDDDDWEPDMDFFVQLYDANTHAELTGQDTKTRVTIIDDDKPGQIAFEDSKGLKVSPHAEFVDIVVIRKNGSDGRVTVNYSTVELASQDPDHLTIENVYYEPKKGQLVFENTEIEKTV